MLKRRIAGTVLAAALALIGAQLVSSAPAAAANGTTAVRTLTYDTRSAGEFVSAWDQGAQVWNDNIPGLRLVRVAAGQRANITIRVDDGWPRAYVTSLGNGTVYMGRQAIQLGHYPPRITAHELGHILGLPDRRTGLCSDLMSGSSAPASCRNPQPSPRERAEVRARFPGLAAVSYAGSAVAPAGLVDCFPASAQEHVHV